MMISLHLNMRELLKYLYSCNYANTVISFVKINKLLCS